MPQFLPVRYSVMAEARRNLVAKAQEALGVLEALAAHLGVVATSVPEVPSGRAHGGVVIHSPRSLAESLLRR